MTAPICHDCGMGYSCPEHDPRPPVTAPTPDPAVSALAEASGDPAAFRLVYSMLMRRYDDSCRLGHMTEFADEVSAVAVQILRKSGRLLPPDTDTRVECDINWTDVRSSRPGADVYAKSYDWPADQFDRWLAREIDAEGHRHRVPVDLRKRTVSTWDGWTLVGPWVPVPTTPETPA